jgi:2-polyprenyl-3-methyl-5-hydroxy-6-metoxy-1,4-benzoquinol methylase
MSTQRFPGPGARQNLRQYFLCPECGSALEWREHDLHCSPGCGKSVPIASGIPRFVQSDTHENFSIQWRKFWDVQLDSKNGSTESRDRLLAQSGLRPEDFAGKLILEVGCGAGRFTEILVGFGSRIVSVDYSGSIDACASSNQAAISTGQLVVAQADVFHLPFKQAAFDIVLAYGMLQHTGEPDRALEALWKHVRPEGLLLVDRYQLSLRNVQPFKYLFRPFLKKVSPHRILEGCDRLCRVLVPMQRAALQRLQGDGPARYLRYVINRSPNSVYPLNLELQGKIDSDVARRWSVLDTFDQYAPKYDFPCTSRQWRRELSSLSGGEVISWGSVSGQGNVGVVRRRPN